MQTASYVVPQSKAAKYATTGLPYRLELTILANRVYGEFSTVFVLIAST